MANLPITIAKAASTQNLTVKSGATSVTIAKNEYGDDYIGDMFFNIPDALKTKSAIQFQSPDASGCAKINACAFAPLPCVKLLIVIFTVMEVWNTAGKSWRAFC